MSSIKIDMKNKLGVVIGVAVLLTLVSWTYHNNSQQLDLSTEQNVRALVLAISDPADAVKFLHSGGEKRIVPITTKGGCTPDITDSYLELFDDRGVCFGYWPGTDEQAKAFKRPIAIQYISFSGKFEGVLPYNINVGKTTIEEARKELSNYHWRNEGGMRGEKEDRYILITEHIALHAIDKDSFPDGFNYRQSDLGLYYAEKVIEKIVFNAKSYK
jgi:hypothetical protein